MSFDITGKLLEVYPVITVNDRFRKREFILERTETKNSFDFTDYIKFQLTQDRCNLIDLFRKGDSIKVSFNLRGRKWEKDGSVNYFTNLEAWKIEKDIIVQSPATEEQIPLPEDLYPERPDLSSPDEEIIDDLPF